METTVEKYLEDSESLLDDIQRRWLKPRGAVGACQHRVLFQANWCFARMFFRFHIEGRNLLPNSPPVIFAPNHESTLDAPLLAAALPYAIVRQTYWAGRKGRVLNGVVARSLNRVAQAIPIDRDLSALAAGAAVLRRRYNLVWFPEGTRSRDGELQEFKFGVGALARYFNVPVVPVHLEGAFEAMPADKAMPRWFAPITVRFGQPLAPDDVVDNNVDEHEAYDEVAEELQQRVEQLGDRNSKEAIDDKP